MAAEPHPMTLRATTFDVAAAVALLATPACSPTPASDPITYTKDVQPIFMAHCVRCHGANGTLNEIPGVPTAHPAPQFCYLQQYDDDPVGCSADGGVGDPSCHVGASSPACTVVIPAYIREPDDNKMRMPPKPSDRLDNWEKDIINRWTSERPPAR